MGLKLTIPKESNSFYVDFIDAYWYIRDIRYSMDTCVFELDAHPSREAKNLDLTELTPFGIGGSQHGTRYNSILHSWTGCAPI